MHLMARHSRHFLTAENFTWIDTLYRKHTQTTTKEVVIVPSTSSWGKMADKLYHQKILLTEFSVW